MDGWLDTLPSAYDMVLDVATVCEGFVHPLTFTIVGKSHSRYHGVKGRHGASAGVPDGKLPCMLSVRNDHSLRTRFDSGRICVPGADSRTDWRPLPRK